ncbi:MAG: hypothetical protein KC613_27945 [Myxococcales bacterium]|nr:hypothetical protein [Myxococcales bacterium]MCB9524923.1 hypothetical protein [Myxococcales bacterium]
MRRLIPLSLATVSLLACGEPTEPTPAAAGDLCAQANARLAACFPEQPSGQACHGGTAQRIADATCDELAAADAKADGGWMCFWTPWLCASGGGGAATVDTYTLFVGTSRCGTYFGAGDDCTYYYASACTEVGLFKDGVELERKFSSTHGNVRFDLAEKGDYEVRVFDRAGEITTQIKGTFDYRYEPAVEAVTVGDAAEVRLGFDLPNDSEAKVKQCAPVTVDLTVETAAGERVESKQVEWDWFVRFLQPDGTVDVTRPFSIHPDATGEADYVNRTTFHGIYKGESLVEFIRMDIPEWRQENNPDYEALLDRYAVESVDPVAVPFTLEDGQIPAGAGFSYGVIDPLTE